VQSGRSIREVQEILGHKTMAMTQRYAHLGPKHLRTAISALDGILPADGRKGIDASRRKARACCRSSRRDSVKPG